MIFSIALTCVGAAGYMVWQVYKSDGRKLRTLWRAGGLYNRDGDMPELREKRKTDYGYLLRLSLPPGLSTKDFENRQQAIEQHLGHRVGITYNNKNMFVKVFEHDLEIFPFEVPKLPGLQLPIGYTYGKQLVTVDLNREPHLGIWGETGGGKSTALRAILTFIYLTMPGAVVHLVDLKEGVELLLFERCKQTASFADDIDKAITTFNQVHREIKRRYKLFREAGDAVDIHEYNKKHRPLPYIFLVIDEFAELMERNDTDFVVERLAAIGRAAGLRMIVSTQRPDVKVINGRIKANIPAVLGLKTKDDTNSRIIIDEGGLEDLRGQGHGWLKHQGKLTELQTMNLQPEQARDLLKPLYVNKALSEPEPDDTTGLVDPDFLEED